MQLQTLSPLMLADSTEKNVTGVNSYLPWRDHIRTEGINKFDREEWMRFTIADLFSNKTGIKALGIQSDALSTTLTSPSNANFLKAQDVLQGLKVVNGSLLAEWVFHVAKEWIFLTLDASNENRPVDVHFRVHSSPTENTVYYCKLIVEAKSGVNLKLNVCVPELPQGSSAHISIDVLTHEGVVLEVEEHQPDKSTGNCSVSLRCLVKDKSIVTYRSVFMGQMVSKSSIHVTLESASKFTAVNAGVLTGSSRRHLIVKVDHRGVGSVSRQIHKVVVTNHAICEFDSQVFVHHSAKQSDSHQLSRHILLSDDARVYANPRLKIETDEVICGHGATVGGLDQDALYYFTSRGISRRDAKHALIQAFINEAASYDQEVPCEEKQHQITVALADLFRDE